MTGPATIMPTAPSFPSQNTAKLADRRQRGRRRCRQVAAVSRQLLAGLDGRADTPDRREPGCRPSSATTAPRAPPHAGAMTLPLPIMMPLLQPLAASAEKTAQIRFAEELSALPLSRRPRCRPKLICASRPDDPQLSRAAERCSLAHSGANSSCPLNANASKPATAADAPAGTPAAGFVRDGRRSGAVIRYSHGRTPCRSCRAASANRSAPAPSRHPTRSASPNRAMPPRRRRTNVDAAIGASTAAAVAACLSRTAALPLAPHPDARSGQDGERGERRARWARR